MKKLFYKSWTLWVNFSILVLSLFDSQFFSSIGVNEDVSLVITSILLKLVAVANIGLRLFSSSSLTAKSEPDVSGN